MTAATAAPTRRPRRARQTPSAARLEHRQRVNALLERHIDFVPNQDFRLAETAPSEAELLPEQCGLGPVGLPAHLSRMCAHDVLSPQEETALFREMNWLKFRASKLRARLDSAHVDQELVEDIESLLARAEEIRDHLIKSNMRLAMSIAKKFVTPRHSFDEVLSDAILTLMRAVEKFDFDRGFRFSTYAYRSIARNAYRTIKIAQRDEARCHLDAADWTLEQTDDRNSSVAGDQAWSNLRDALATMLPRLDRRERFIIRCRYALGSHRKARTFQSLADKLGVSKERARQLEKRAVEKLQSMAEEYEADELLGAAMA